MTHRTGRRRFNAVLAAAVLGGAIASNAAADAEVTYWESYANANGRLQDGRITVGVPFNTTFSGTSLADVSSHNLIVSESNSPIPTLSSQATASTTAGSNDTPYILDLDIGTQAGGALVSGSTDLSSYQSRSFQHIEFTVSGDYELSFNWSSSNSSIGGGAQNSAYVYDITALQYVGGTSAAYWSDSRSGGFSGLGLEDGHSYRIFTQSKAFDLRTCTRSHDIADTRV